MAETKHYTADGVEITHGLRVRTYDWKWGTVDASNVNDKFFDGWFTVTHDDGTTNSFDGERMTTQPFPKK